MTEDSWPAEAWAESYRESTFDEEASEAIGEEFLEVLRLWDISWTPCSEHAAGSQVCSAPWEESPVGWWGLRSNGGAA